MFAGFPLKYTPESAGESRLIFTPAVYWWGFTITLFQLGFMCFECCLKFMSYPSILVTETDSTLSVYAMIIFYGSGLLMALVLFTSYARTNPEFLKICTFLEQFDHELHLESPDYSITENLFTVIISTAIPTVLGASFQYSISLNEEHDFVVRRIMVYFVVTTALYGRTALLIHFQQVTYGISKRFRLVKARIRLLVMNESFKRRILHRNPICVDRTQDYMTCKKVKSLLSAYHLICDAVCQANVFYGDPLLVCIVCTFMRIIEDCFFLFIYGYVIGGKTVIIGAISGWIFSDAIFLVLITLCGSCVSETAGDIATLIRKLINQDLGSELREELKSFLLQLANKNVEFSAGGFFQVNRQTLTSMVAAVTTYLVIMIQFEIQSKSQPDRSGMERPHPGGTAYVITVTSSPGRSLWKVLSSRNSRPLAAPGLCDLPVTVNSRSLNATVFKLAL
ncbi:gustatory receptor 23a-like [Homalodisca vitripennis]|uniref:gustatory receptor 23a-like n=1 Tax=Homalodisca vitripennis TaxID=197043 RepID=UPI001EEC5C75|nr:gustatory receptor 23a-like [Homalodisca vitripennis]